MPVPDEPRVYRPVIVPGAPFDGRAAQPGVGRATGTSFVFTDAQGYVFSNVYRQPGTYDVSGLAVKQPGVYTLTATYINACGTSVPVSQTVTVSRSCP